MNIKLNTITKQYRKFLDEQVLTEGQLNEFIDYFDTQDRLTRTQLTGTGILCGFKPTLEYNTTNSQPYIRISQGVGITTDGDLISLQEKVESEDIFDVEEVLISGDDQIYPYYKVFKDEVNYFEGISGEILELVYDIDTIIEGGQSEVSKEYKAFTKSFDFTDKVVLLYLESFSQTEDICEGINCDTQGVPEINNLKVLLVDIDAAEAIIKSDSLFTKYEGYKTLHEELPSLEVRRMVFTENDIQGPSSFNTLYKKVITEAPIITASLSEAFVKIASKFTINLNLNTGQQLIDKINSVVNFNGTDYQYRYSLLKDLVDTYNEIRGAILKLHSECIVDITAFPKHLLLGSTLPESTTVINDLLEESAYRHEFYKAAPLSHQNQYFQRVVFLANRFVKLLSSYNYVSTGGVVITPSNRNLVLGSKAIPFYYNINDEFLANWNFDSTKNKRHTYQLSYHRSKLSSATEVQQPFSFEIENYDFYRIEGHVGQDYQDVYNKVKDLRASYGLAFNIRVVRLQGEDELEPAKDKIPTELLSEYMERNSGLVHRGGVQQGGTIVFVIQAERYSGVTTKSIYNRVLADFSLPYACCETKEKVLASISTDALCYNSAPIPIDVVPFDGDLKAFINGVEQTAVIVKTGTKHLFDPSRISVANLEKSINFTINDERVANTLVVHALPEIAVTAGSIEYNDTAEKATVVFNVTGKNLLNYDYFWDWDDRTTSVSKPKNGVITHEFDLEANEEEQFLPTVTVTNASGCAETINISLSPLKLVINKDTKIRIYFDASGSMDTTLAPLNSMVAINLKERLLPLYGNESAIYDENVKVKSFRGERTFDMLNMEGDTPDGNVIVMVFQDEAQSIYHTSTINNNTPTYQSDMSTLRNRISNNFGTGNPNYYRGIIFQVEGSAAFKKFITAVKQGTSPYNGSNGLSTVDEVSTVYDVKDGDTYLNYGDLIVATLQNLGYNL